MAKDKEPTVEVPVSVLADLKASVESLAARLRLAEEKTESVHAKQVYDAAWERRVADASRSAAEKTQEASDRQYGTTLPRWRVWLDSAGEDGRPGPNVSDWPSVFISANSPEEAEARWMRLCGVRSHKHVLRSEAA